MWGYKRRAPSISGTWHCWLSTRGKKTHNDKTDSTKALVNETRCMHACIDKDRTKKAFTQSRTQVASASPATRRAASSDSYALHVVLTMQSRARMKAKEVILFCYVQKKKETIYENAKK